VKYGRKILEAVTGYVPGEQPVDLNVIKLNTNENPYSPSPRVVEAMRALGTEALRRYPDPSASAFRQECAKRYGLPGTDWIIAGNGMDELLSLVIRTFVDPDEKVLAPYPTYSLYDVLCKLHGCEMISVDLDGHFQLPERFYETPAKLCLLARPNAPSGVSVPRVDVERLCQGFPGIVVIDEAYVDFGDDHCMDFPARFENAVVMRTFSKSFSLAGMRIGIAVARPEIINEFMKVKDSYNMSAFSEAAALAAVKDYGYMRDNVERVRATRGRLHTALAAMGFDIPESQSNFLLARWDGTPTAREIFETLRDRGIYVRYFASRGLENALRITVGTDEQCGALVHALAEIVRK
jgi:histidinol-phosphate aminotransferase